MGRILCLEGISGAGKTEQARMLDAYLASLGVSYLIINEKTLEPFGSVVKSWHARGANQKFTRSDVEQFAKAKAEAHRSNLSSLSLDYLVFDRSVYTAAVYQEGELTPEEILKINREEGVIMPESGVILVCEPELAKQRIDARRKQGRIYTLPAMHETIEEITRRKWLYEQLALLHPELTLINSNRDVDIVFKDIKPAMRL